eukprot:5737570-Pyramimonas_sp.AAC.1
MAHNGQVFAEPRPWPRSCAGTGRGSSPREVSTSSCWRLGCWRARRTGRRRTPRKRPPLPSACAGAASDAP